jgi:hypothetical protein
MGSLSDLIAASTAGQRVFQMFMKLHPNAAGTAATWHSPWTYGGFPAAGDVSGAALTAVQCTTSTTGSLYHGGAVTPLTKHLTKVGLMCSGSNMVPGAILVYDRLLYYPGIDASVNTSQALTNGVALPRYTDGLGVRAWLEVTTVFGAVIGVFTYGTSGYTNSAGDTGRQHGVTCNTTASSPVNRLPHSGSTAQNNMWNPFLPMQAGDRGIRSVQSVRFTTAPSSGACALVLGYPLALFPIPDNNAYVERDLIFQTPSLPRIYDGACLSFLYVPLTAVQANSVLLGDVEAIWL